MKLQPEPAQDGHYDLVMEQALLGAILKDFPEIKLIASSLKARDFYDPLHARIFDELLSSYQRGIIMLSPLSLAAAMKDDSGLTAAGGRKYLDGLAMATRPGETVQSQAKIIANLAIRRSIGSITATPYIWTDPRLLPPRPRLYGRHLFRRYTSATIAAGGIGKSSLNIVEDLAMVTGRPLLGVAPVHPLRVWSWNLEDPADEIDLRIAAACLHYGISASAIGGRLFRDSGRDMPCRIAQIDRAGAFIVEPLIDEIVDELIRRKIDVLRIDPFVSSHSIPESDNGAIDMVAKEWGRVAHLANCAIDLTHHARKTGGKEITAEDGRGASALINACRSVRVLNRMTEVDAASAGVEHRRLYFSVLIDKANLAPPSDKADWFKLESIDIGNGPPSDRVGVVVPWQWPDAFDGILPGTLFAVQKRIADGEWRENPQAKEWAGKAVAEVLHLDILDKSVRARCRTLLHSWIQGGALIVVSKLDDKRRERQFIEVGQWVAE
jgi:hypothetical protein